jgi:hypothetical protein
MLARDFCFWLQGAIELGKIQAPLTSEQTDMIVRHLSLVTPPALALNRLRPADRLIYRITVLHEVGANWGSGNVWETLVAQLHEVFEHQLDHEVPFNPGHGHGSQMRC